MASWTLQRSLLVQLILRPKNQRVLRLRLSRPLPATLHFPCLHTCDTRARAVDGTARYSGHHGLQTMYLGQPPRICVWYPAPTPCSPRTLSEKSKGDQHCQHSHTSWNSKDEQCPSYAIVQQPYLETCPTSRTPYPPAHTARPNTPVALPNITQGADTRCIFRHDPKTVQQSSNTQQLPYQPRGYQPTPD